MQQNHQSWQILFRRIPNDLHDCLALGMQTGCEIVMQALVKLEIEFMIIRGRLSGTQDSGRIIIIPYEQISFVALTRLLKDSEVEAIFGKDVPSGLIATVVPSMENGIQKPPEPPAEGSHDSDARVETEENVAKKSDQPSKKELLAKLRERLKESN